MKRITAILVLAVFILSCQQKPKSNLPVFNILLTDSSSILNTANIPKGKPVMLVYFETDCEYCQQETKDIIDHIDALRDIRFYFVSVSTLDDIKFYRKYYHLENYTNIEIGRDTGFYLLKHYTIRKTPYMMLYNKDKVLKAVLAGAVSSDTIATFAHKL